MEKVFPQHSKIIQELFGGLSQDEIENLSESLKKIGFKAVDLFECSED